VLLAPRQFSQIVYQSVIPNGPNENKVNGIFIFQGIHITQLIFPGIQKHLIRSPFPA
jgi:hypothetical protein